MWDDSLAPPCWEWCESVTFLRICGGDIWTSFIFVLETRNYVLLRCKLCAFYHQESIVSRCIFGEIGRILSCMRSRPIQNLLCTRSRQTPDVARAHQSIPARRQRGAVVRPSRSSCRATARQHDGETASVRTRASCASWNGGVPELAALFTSIGFISQVNVASNYICIVNSSVHLCINSSLDGVISFEILKVEFKKSGFRVRLVCTVIHRDRFDDFRPAAKESQFQGFEGFGGGTYGYATSYQTAVLVLSSAVIADVVLMYAGGIVAETEGCQSQKDRAEQARCKF